MAINATLTCTTYNQPMRAHHIGPNYVFGSLATSARTLSDIILLCRVPHGGTIVDFGLVGATAATAAVCKVGIKGENDNEVAGADDTILASFDFATTAGVRASAFIGWKVSLSDTDAHAGADVYMTVVSGTWTISISFDFQLAYVMSGAGRPN